MAPTLLTTVPKIAKPAVKREEAADGEGGEDQLPLGILLTGGAKLRAEGKTGKGVKVAVIDSGIDEAHPGFKGKVVQQVWFRAGTPLEEDDHGTHVAGTIHMMAPEAELYDYRVFGAEGLDIDYSIASAIIEAVFDGCQVINMSLGGRLASPDIRTAIVYAEKKGVIVVCAAGNEGDDNPLTNERSFPAMWEEVFSVAAISKEDGLPVARFSNSNPHVDYAGIGVNVKSFKPGGGYQVMSGTSMACPHVAGLIAALLTGDRLRRLGSRKDNVVRAYLNNVLKVDIGKKGPDTETGVGFLTYLGKNEFDEIMDKI